MRHSKLVATLCLASCTAAPRSPASQAEESSGTPWSCSARVELSTVWDHLSKRYDADEDGSITRLEYTRGATRFANYDRSEDGLLTRDDFPDDTFFNGFSHMLLRRADGDEDGEITASEWKTFTSQFDGDGDGRVVRSEVEAVMGSWTDDWPIFLLSFDQDSDGDFDGTDLALTFRDQDYNGDGALAGRELEGWQPVMERSEVEPPAAGEAAPDFSLTYADRPDSVWRLSDAAKARPVALIFGSYT